ncbi:hypothetical protein PMAYCL1PPCAC_00299, partial [Pristionchus mayeri]
QYLALHSSYFFNIFYGPNATGLAERIELDCDPHTFGDLLDIVYPSYKKIYCCGECSSSTENRLNLGIDLKMKFAIKRLLKGNFASEEAVAITEKFPDEATVTVQGPAVTVSPSALSLHSPLLHDMFYKDGQLVKNVQLDMDREPFQAFIRAVTGNFP